MPSAPRILPTQIQQGTAPGVDISARGRARPGAAHGARRPDPGLLRAPRAAVEVPAAADRPAPAKKGLKRRVFGGMPLLLLEAQSAGEIAFSRDAPGHIVALHLQPGEGDHRPRAPVPRRHRRRPVRLQPDQGLRQHALRRRLLRRPVLAGDHEGVVWIHGYGNVFEKTLEPGETIDIEPGGWVYRDHTVQMTQEVYGFKTGFLGGGRQPRLQPIHRARAGSGSRAPTSTAGGRRAPAAAPAARGRRRAARQASSAACSTTSRDGHDFAPGHLAEHPLPAGHRRRARSERLPAAGRRRRRRRRPARVAGVPARRARTRSVAPRRRARRSRCTSTRLRDEREASALHPARRPARLPAPVGVPAGARARRPAQQGQRRQPGHRCDRRDTIPDKHAGRLFGGGGEAPRAGRASPRLCRPPARRRIPRTRS